MAVFEYVRPFMNSQYNVHFYFWFNICTHLLYMNSKTGSVNALCSNMLYN